MFRHMLKVALLTAAFEQYVDLEYRLRLRTDMLHGHIRAANAIGSPPICFSESWRNGKSVLVRNQGSANNKWEIYDESHK